jgi:hypothetical protein
VVSHSKVTISVVTISAPCNILRSSSDLNPNGACYAYP